MRPGCPKIAGVLLAGAICASAQFSDVAVTADGSEIYFVSRLRLASEAALNLPATTAIYRVKGNSIERLTAPPPYSIGARSQSQGNPQVSGSGQVFSYTEYDNCYGGSSCISRPSTSSSVVSVGGQLQAKALAGEAQLSRNGRFVFSALQFPGFTFPRQSDILTWTDLQTGTAVTATVRPASRRQALTAAGAVLGFDVATNLLTLWEPQRSRIVPTVEVPRSAIVDDAGTWVVYEAAGSAGFHLRTFDLASGRDRLLATRPGDPVQSGSFAPSISDDGSTVVYLSEDQPEKSVQLWSVRPDGSGRRRLTDFPEDVSYIAIAGNGRSAVAITGSRIVGVDLQSGDQREWIGRTPTCVPGFTALVPGSILPVRGSDLAVSTIVAAPPLPSELAGVRVLLDEVALPLLSVSPSEIWFQVPFELPVHTTASVRVPHQSLFEGCPTVRAAVEERSPYFFSTSELILAHQEFRGLVTTESPARPGEIVSAYAVGLGAVSPSMATGIPTPASPLFRLSGAFECHVGYQLEGPPLDVAFAGLAPGMIGIYQVNVRMPDPAPVDGVFFLNCGTPGSETERGGGIVLIAAQ